MKNEHLYEQYAITGWPCHFYTMKAHDKYNQLIEDMCKSAPEGARDLSLVQKIRRRCVILYLDVMDTFWYKP